MFFIIISEIGTLCQALKTYSSLSLVLLSTYRSSNITVYYLKLRRFLRLASFCFYYKMNKRIIFRSKNCVSFWKYTVSSTAHQSKIEYNNSSNWVIHHMIKLYIYYFRIYKFLLLILLRVTAINSLMAVNHCNIFRKKFYIQKYYNLYLWITKLR